ncbi:MAG TPA: hypothetical protein VFR58_09210 [Flavisolibacter sp.]|nr:hypothetical protein [Flavisolibacter sp.]
MQKTGFRYFDKKEFVSDSLLRAEYKTFNTLRHPLFERIMGSKVYLYSWQERDKSKNEFTVVGDDGELGLKIFYFILDKKDSLLSWKQVSGAGGEGGYLFETSSRFISRDTLLSLGSITRMAMAGERGFMQESMGDTSFSYVVILPNGQLSTRLFKEVKQLDFENEQWIE